MLGQVENSSNQVTNSLMNPKANAFGGGLFGVEGAPLTRAAANEQF